MNHELTCSRITCPYCGESLEIFIDGTAGNQRYIEDCQVCCSPIELAIEVAANGEIEQVVARRDNE